MSEKLFESLRSGGRVSSEQVSLWSGVAGLLAGLDAIGREGANVVVKIDGGRPDGSFYTVVISGGRLEEEFFRKDSGDLAALLQEAVEFYKVRVWSNTG
jgi:hypothetical protein